MTKVVGKLVDVPITLGATTTDTPVKATFYILDNPTYHWLFGLTLLEAVNGVVHCKDRLLTFHQPGGPTPTVVLPLTSRAAATSEPVYSLFRQLRSTFQDRT